MTEHSPIWRNTVCTGCPAACRYRDLRGSGVTFVETYDALLQESRRRAAAGDYSYRVTRAKILGRMHEDKRATWEHQVTVCPERTSFDAPLWAPVDDIRRPQEQRLPLRLEALLVAIGDGPVSVADAQALLGGVTRAAAYKVLARLVRKGLLLHDGRDRYLALGTAPF